MKKSIILIFFLTFTSLFAQNISVIQNDIKEIKDSIKELRATIKDDIRMLIEQNREEHRIIREDTNKRFEMMQNQMDKRFEDMQNMMFFGFALIAAILGFLFIQNQSMIRSNSKLESKIDNISQILSFQETITKTTKSLSKVQKTPERSFETEIDLASLLKNSDKQTKQKIAKEIKQLLEV